MHPPPRGSMTRHRLIGAAFAIGSLAAIDGARRAFSQASGPFSLPPLPYPEDALAPVISGTTIGFHYGKHHRAYVDNLNKAIEGTVLADKSLEDIVKATAGDPARIGIFNNAAQNWNHTFYWNSMRPNGGGTPTGVIADHIKDAFGDYAKFRQEFATAAVTQFGSGWAWLVQDRDKKLKVVKTANADGARDHLSLDMRCLGARLLSRLPEPPSGLRQRLARQARELGLRLATTRPMTTTSTRCYSSFSRKRRESGIPERKSQHLPLDPRFGEGDGKI